MKNIFDFTDYRLFLKAYLKQMPKEGYGQARKLAAHIQVHTSLISQILNGLKELSADQAVGTAEFLGLSEVETDYFLAMTQLGRAGTELLKKTARRQMAEIKKRGTTLSERTKYERILSDEQRAIFYSSWIYSAIRQLSAIDEGVDMETLNQKLGLPKTIINRSVEFLLATGLCNEKQGKIKIGKARTYLEPESPWARVYHQTWRQRAASSVEKMRATDFHYTSPVTLSVEDAEKVRAFLVETVQNINSVIDPSPSQALRCLCIDWFDPL